MFGLLRSPNQPQLASTSYVLLPWLFGTCISFSADYSNTFYVKSLLAVIGNFYVKSIITLPYFCVKQPIRRSLNSAICHFFSWNHYKYKIFESCLCGKVVRNTIITIFTWKSTFFRQIIIFIKEAQKCLSVIASYNTFPTLSISQCGEKSEFRTFLSPKKYFVKSTL